MAIDLLKEQVTTLSQAASRLPKLRSNRPVHPATLWRWTTVGLRGVRLESARLGGRNVTSLQALERFFAALNDQPLPAKKGDEQQRDVERQLAALGV